MRKRTHSVDRRLPRRPRIRQRQGHKAGTQGWGRQRLRVNPLARQSVGVLQTPERDGVNHDLVALVWAAVAADCILKLDRRIC